jgi:hypothetical protein
METNVSDNEIIVRILNQDWFEEGELMHVAFALRHNETYLSVNRPAIETFGNDVAEFVKSHSQYLFSNKTYRGAILNVGEVRNIKVKIADTIVDIDVEVESRDTHTKSHAGIFTRNQNKNIKSGGSIYIPSLKENISADNILLKVRFQLLKLSKIEEKSLL